MHAPNGNQLLLFLFSYLILSYFLNVNYGQVYGSLDGLDDSRRPTQEV